MADKPLAYAVHLHETDIEYLLCADEDEAEDAAADKAERAGVKEWDIIPLFPGEPITIELK